MCARRDRARSAHRRAHDARGAGSGVGESRPSGLRDDPQYNEQMGTHRVERVAAQLRQEISEIIIRDLKDPRIGMATITEVKLTPDLRNATVKVSVVAEDDGRQAAIDGLEHAKGFIRRELGSRLSNLRFAPDLHFQLDEGVAYSVRISQLLHEVQQGESNAGS
ncbi:MAG: 30S ribosome-binding factor RbfA [Chloroflexi bacterium]|nr:MAG: 30S ribosome-binding factor RbfA [Chloroflexota bacterium]